MPSPDEGKPPTPPPTPTIALVPLADFSNTALRDSVAAAIAGAGIPDGHSHVALEVSNKGAGLMVMERFGNSWAAILSGRYNKGSGSEVKVAVQGSW